MWLSGATMISRVLGLARDQLFAILIGANRFSDAFVVAFRIPNLLRDLFAEGALSSAFVPAFADAHRNRGRDAAYRLGNAVVAIVLLAVGGSSPRSGWCSRTSSSRPSLRASRLRASPRCSRGS